MYDVHEQSRGMSEPVQFQEGTYIELVSSQQNAYYQPLINNVGETHPSQFANKNLSQKEVIKELKCKLKSVRMCLAVMSLITVLLLLIALVGMFLAAFSLHRNTKDHSSQILKQLETIQSDLNLLVAQVNSLDTRVNTSQRNVTLVRNEVIGLQHKYSVMVESNVSTNVDALQTELRVVNSLQHQLQKNITLVSAKYNALRTEVIGLQHKYLIVESNVSTDVDALQTELSAVNSLQHQLQANITIVSAKCSALRTEFNEAKHRPVTVKPYQNCYQDIATCRVTFTTRWLPWPSCNTATLPINVTVSNANQINWMKVTI